MNGEVMNNKSRVGTTIKFAALAFALFVWIIPVRADDAAPKFLRIPVFFITDRNLAPPKKHPDVVDFGPHRKYIDECKHDPFMGTAYFVMPNLEGKQLTKHLLDLGWAPAEGKEKEGNFKATLLQRDSFDTIEKDFYDKVHQEALLSPDKNIFVFAHGYKNSFQSGLHTAAKMSYYAERPLIFYSWPSVAKFRSYDSDENNVEWSQEHFNEVVTQLDQLCTADPSVKIRLMAHSMGTRLVVRACPLLREKPWLVEADLICPDIDDGLVKHYAKRYLSKNGTCMIRVYMSQGDKALAISQMLHGGYTRFGEQADSLSGWALATMKGTSGKQEKAATDDPELAAVIEKTKHRMQTIDFTNIDRPFVGHAVPAKLICSMSFTNGPCSGLQLVPEESGGRSKLSQRLSKATKLRSNQELSIKGTCLRVVRLDKNYNKQIAKIPIAPSP
jgi:Alpha/beta hydrolase of unknown function (DUF900)